MENRKEVLIIIPAYNEEKTIVPVLEKLEQPEIAQIADVLVMNDASSDATNHVTSLLPVYDNIERAAAYTDADAEKLAEGIRLTVKSFDEALKKLGVTEIEAKTFDPSLHNAVMHVEDETKGDGEIVEVFQKGYKKGDKVIRYAMVKSAN